MGMYDNIEEYQVKCFDWPYFYEDSIMGKGISFSGGELRGFGKGCDVPYKTGWYDYSPNFGIYVYYYFSRESADEDVGFIVIKNGKVKKIIRDITKIKETDLKGLNRIIDRYGTPLNIQKPEDFLNLKEDLLTYSELYNRVNKKSNEILKEWTHYVHMQSGTSPIDDGLTIEEINKKIEEFPTLLDKEKENIEKDLKRLSETYIYPWKGKVKIDEYTKVLEQFGAALHCRESIKGKISTPLKKNASDWEKESREKEFRNFYGVSSLLEEILDKNKDIIKDFAKWQDLSEREIKKIENTMKEIEELKESH